MEIKEIYFLNLNLVEKETKIDRKNVAKPRKRQGNWIKEIKGILSQINLDL